MRAFSLIALLCAFAIPVAGCGGDDDNSSSGNGGSSSGGAKSDTSGGASSGGGGGGQTLKLSADPNGALKFNKSSLSAKAGKVTIAMDNPSSLPHAIEVEGKGQELKGDTVTKGGASKVSGTLKAGTYDFYCPVDGHKAAGMKGTLTVK
jgi:plastocyanin